MNGRAEREYECDEIYKERRGRGHSGRGLVVRAGARRIQSGSGPVVERQLGWYDSVSNFGWKGYLTSKTGLLYRTQYQNINIAKNLKKKMIDTLLKS